MKATVLILMLQKFIDDRGDGEVQFGLFSGDADDSEYHDIKDITLENINHHYIVLWDTE